MTMMTNSTQAVKEVTGFDDDTSSAQSGTLGKKTTGFNSDRKVAQNNSRERIEINIPTKYDGTDSNITSTMIINGQVEGSAGINVMGRINGNVKVSSNALINGKIIGDVSADSLKISGAVKGNIHADGNIQVDNDAAIVGDVDSKNITVDGKISGDISCNNLKL